MAATPDRDLGDARSALDHGDGRAALKSLDRARRGYVKRREEDGLEHVLDMAALVEPHDEGTGTARENLVYAVKQNLRLESRRSARERREPWTDPYPDLQAPEEHTRIALTRGAKIAIGVGVIASLAALTGIVLAAALGGSTSSTVTVRLVNDTGETVDVRGCDDPGCATTFMHRNLGPGVHADTDVDPDTLVKLFTLERDGAKRCLPLRIHDAYQRLQHGGVLSARLSEASPCPGTTVLPRPAEAAPI